MENVFFFRQLVRLGEYDTETNPVDCIDYEDDKDCNDPPFDSAVISKFDVRSSVIHNTCIIQLNQLFF